jgi:serine/threonine protein kinase
VALKKVRFDSVEPESVRFMAREIIILRRLQRHPNVVGLEGLITSRSSRALYLVFEYMEHDLAGLTSSPDVTFTEPQVHIHVYLHIYAYMIRIKSNTECACDFFRSSATCGSCWRGWRTATRAG